MSDTKPDSDIVCCRCGKKPVTDAMMDDVETGEELWCCAKCDDIWDKVWEEYGEPLCGKNQTNDEFDRVWNATFYKHFLGGFPPITKKIKVQFT